MSPKRLLDLSRIEAINNPAFANQLRDMLNEIEISEAQSLYNRRLEANG